MIIGDKDKIDYYNEDKLAHAMLKLFANKQNGITSKCLLKSLGIFDKFDSYPVALKVIHEDGLSGFEFLITSIMYYDVYRVFDDRVEHTHVD